MDYPNALADEFNKFFAIVEADTPKLREQAYRLRYQVYCLESQFPGFEEFMFPDGEETDAYDKQALHGLLLHKASGRAAGTTRLVLPMLSDPLWMFPVETYVGDLRRYIEPAPNRAKVAEISRFILSGEFRRRGREHDVPDGVVDDQDARIFDISDRRHIPHPVIGLMKICVMLSWQHGIQFWCAGMEPRLQRRLCRFGVGLNEVATSVYYHGSVNLYFSYIPDVLRRCYEQNRDVWAFLTDGGRMWPIADKSPDGTSKQQSNFQAKMVDGHINLADERPS